MSEERPVVSIIVNNYNYGRFVRGAIDSALAQTYRPLEVVVVDDGSTDDSRDVIESYGESVIALFKENGGQASAFNAGFEASSGEVIIYLDSDDVLSSTAVEAVLQQFTPSVVKVHWPLWRVDENLNGNGQQVPSEPLPVGDLRDAMMRDGPGSSLSPPTSGNAWSRSFLRQVMPIPEAEHRIGADGFIYGIAPAFGLTRRVETPQGVYRIHPKNNYKHMDVAERIGRGIRSFELQVDVLSNLAAEAGLVVEPDRWRQRSYFYQLRDAIADLESVVPEGESLILLDESRWSLEQPLGNRQVLPFIEKDGVYWGTPSSDDVAISELERMRDSYKVKFIVVAWPAFWWLEEYRAFGSHLAESFRLLVSNERVMVYALSDN